MTTLSFSRAPFAGAISLLLVVAFGLAGAAAPLLPPGSPGAVRTVEPPRAVGTTVNNTTSALGQALSTFLAWFLGTFEEVIGAVIVVLLVGGVLNYLVVTRSRPAWTPPPPPPTLGGMA